MKNFSTLFLLLAFVACGKDGKNGVNGQDGKTFAPITPVSTSIDMEDIAPGIACASGGVSVFTFKDINGDGLHQADEDVVKVKSICNGINGIDGSSPSVTMEAVASSDLCPQGGVLISSTNSAPVEVCNGKDGLNGEQGIQGIQGVPGIAGANGADGKDGIDGTQVIPVKFCKDDNSTFPEYGLMVGEDLFAVYWGTTPGSPKKDQAFLTKLVPGTYQSTGGNNCIFIVE